MKRTILSIVFIFHLCPVFCNIYSDSSFRRPLDSSDYGRQPYLSSFEFPIISSDGKYIGYTVRDYPQRSKVTVIFQASNLSWKMEDQGISISQAKFSPDNKFLFFLKRDTLNVVTLFNKSIKKISHVTKYDLVKNKPGWLYYLTSDTLGTFHAVDTSFSAEYTFQKVQKYFTTEDSDLLFLVRQVGDGKSDSSILTILTHNDFSATNVYVGRAIKNVEYNESAHQVVFSCLSNSLRKNSFQLVMYDLQKKQIHFVVSENANTSDTTHQLLGDNFNFSNNGHFLFYKVRTKELLPQLSYKTNPNSVDVYCYFDEDLQSYQINKLNVINDGTIYSECLNVSSGEIIRLTKENERVFYSNNDYALVGKDFDPTYDYLFKVPKLVSYIVNLHNGKRFPISCAAGYLHPSPSGKYILYWDIDNRNYVSIEPMSGSTTILYKDLSDSFTDKTVDVKRMMGIDYGLGGWTADEKFILVYDEFDIWKLDITGKMRPIKFTNSYGKRNNIVLRIENLNNISKPINPNEALLLVGFNIENKQNGFLNCLINKIEDPTVYTMGDQVYHLAKRRFSDEIQSDYRVFKAQNKNVYLLTKQSGAEPANYFITSDFREFTQVSAINREPDILWFTKELVTWGLPDGKKCQGILYKPSGFKKNKKYPTIVYLYEKFSDGLNLFNMPVWSSGPLDIPTYVSNGYCVFTPDIHYKVGKPGDGIYNSVVSGVKALLRMSFIDPKRIGVQGHSYGGFEVNYLITHTNIFSVAVEASGTSDFISDYGSIDYIGRSLVFQLENGQHRMGVPFWENFSGYMKYSPINRVNKVTTPLLIMHNQNDARVPWQNASELFIALRRQGKKVWMLQYDGFPGYGHQVMGESSKDYTIRMKQFFDHYLKGYPAPKWMTQGIPARYKGFYSGFDF